MMIPINEPLTAILTSTIQPDFQQRSNQGINYPSMSTVLQENVFCKSYVNTFVEEYSNKIFVTLQTYLRSNNAYHITMEEK